MSALATPLALAELAELERAIAEGVDLTMVHAGAIADGFVGYIWYLAAAAESAHRDRSNAIAGGFRSTLGWAQLPEHHRTRWSAVATHVLDTFEAVPSAMRQRWGRTGTSLATSSAMEALVDDIVAEIATLQAPEITDQIALELLLGAGRIDVLLELPEANVVAPRNRRGGQGTHRLTIDTLGLLRSWMAGTEVQDLADTFLAAVPDPEFRLEQLADYVTAAFDNFLPWALGILVEWVNTREREQRGDEALSVPTSLPAFVRYGVSSMEAVRLIRAGLPSRPLANAIARAYLDDATTGDASLRTWLCRTDVAEWRHRFGASPQDLRMLLEYARTPDARLAAQMLAGERVTIDVRATGATVYQGPVILEPVPDGQSPAMLGLWTGRDLVAQVPPEHLAEVAAIRATGIPLEVSAEPVNTDETPRSRNH